MNLTITIQLANFLLVRPEFLFYFWHRVNGDRKTTPVCLPLK